MKFLFRRRIIDKLYFFLFMSIFTLMSCTLCKETGICNFTGLLKWNFGGFSYDYSFEEDIPYNYLVSMANILLNIGVDSLIDIKRNDYNIILRFGRRRFWKKQSEILLVKVFLYIAVSLMTIYLYALYNNLQMKCDDIYNVLGGVIVNVIPIYMIMYQVILTIQLVIHPVFAIIFVEAIMVGVLSIADKKLIIDKMFLYRDGLFQGKQDVIVCFLYFVIWILIYYIGIRILDKYEFFTLKKDE